jgi:peptide methionine sulfoxide reductase msrA/msrB
MKHVLHFLIIGAVGLGLAGGAAAEEKGAETMNKKQEKIILAGGCFWCVESTFHGVSGIIDAVSGYTGGETQDPAYEEVSMGSTGHYEAVQVTFNPAQISLGDVLNVFWRDIDPTDAGGQFADRGTQYKTAIFYYTDEQKRVVEASRDKLQASGLFDKPIASGLFRKKS